MHHIEAEFKKDWNDERRAAFVAQRIQEKASASQFFKHRQTFELEIYEMDSGNKKPHVRKTYVIRSSQKDFWAALEEELFSMFRMVRGTGKNFSMTPFHILLNRQTLYKRLPRNVTGGNTELFITFATVKKPKPI